MGGRLGLKEGEETASRGHERILRSSRENLGSGIDETNPYPFRCLARLREMSGSIRRQSNDGLITCLKPSNWS